MPLRVTPLTVLKVPGGVQLGAVGGEADGVDLVDGEVGLEGGVHQPGVEVVRREPGPAGRSRCGPDAGSGSR